LARRHDLNFALLGLRRRGLFSLLLCHQLTLSALRSATRLPAHALASPLSTAP